MIVYVSSSTILPLGRHNGPPSPSYSIWADFLYRSGEGFRFVLLWEKICKNHNKRKDSKCLPLWAPIQESEGVRREPDGRGMDSRLSYHSSYKQKTPNHPKRAIWGANIHGSTQSFTQCRDNGRTDRCAISCALPFGWYLLRLFRARFQPWTRFSVLTIWAGTCPIRLHFYK